jgi:hypothetical protein
MFSEQKFISDFMNYTNMDLDYDIVKMHIDNYINDKYFSYNDADLMEIALLYNTFTDDFNEIVILLTNEPCSPDDFRIRANVSLKLLSYKLMTEYLTHEVSDADTDLEESDN